MEDKEKYEKKSRSKCEDYVKDDVRSKDEIENLRGQGKN